jgi:hypothetical protein
MRHSLFPSLSVAASPAQSERPFPKIQSSGEGRSTHGNKRKEKEDEAVTSPQRPKRVRSIRTMDGFEIEIEGSETREASSKPQPEGIKNGHLFGRFSVTPFLPGEDVSSSKARTFLFLLVLFPIAPPLPFL